MRTETEVVRRFYDTFGWQRDERGAYRDTTEFVDTRPVMVWYWHAVHMRVRQFFGRGKYFLDAGSGAIAHPEYLEYSSAYERRICVDISETGLKEARSKLGDKGWYVLADLVHLPFRDGVFDAAISAHVLYHVPKDKQRAVVLELQRTMAQAGICVIIYAQFKRLVDMMPRPWYRVRNMIRCMFRSLELLKHPNNNHAPTRENRPTEVPPLYFFAHDREWFRQTTREWNVDIRTWSSVDNDLTRSIIPNNTIGQCFMKLIFFLETLFPHAGIGYQMIIIQKETPKSLRPLSG